MIRQGEISDYPEFLQAEQQAWKNTGVPVISREQYASWMEVFPEGLLLAEYAGVVCGHVFSQVCSFDPFDESDNRSWNEATDFGFIRATHEPAGRTMYNVSVSACIPGAGKKLLRAAFSQAEASRLQYYTGASSIPGLAVWVKSQQRKMDRSAAEEYVDCVLERKIRDPVISVTLSIEGTEFCRVMENYFDYPGSGGWAALIAYVCASSLACP